MEPDDHARMLSVRTRRPGKEQLEVPLQFAFGTNLCHFSVLPLCRTTGRIPKLASRGA